MKPWLSIWDDFGLVAAAVDFNGMRQNLVGGAAGAAAAVADPAAGACVLVADMTAVRAGGAARVEVGDDGHEAPPRAAAAA